MCCLLSDIDRILTTFWMFCWGFGERREIELRKASSQNKSRKKNKQLGKFWPDYKHLIFSQRAVPERVRNANRKDTLVSTPWSRLCGRCRTCLGVNPFCPFSLDTSWPDHWRLTEQWDPPSEHKAVCVQFLSSLSQHPPKEQELALHFEIGC